ncbi:methylmalonyl Co-A mutase-associated GTPase MeaB [Pseudenhygromyxa sp. WMMC2535]|uniref:methylmalonyl Co-A mutase-associated GTPase MeaB n=1 Tax=Pseudenhygromyxa sp. WMMC2535 TaxID=2712867 RepID=UPI0015569A00|nr:methylmalonyl Co-A mutase-associated GTPase MeaB [Pseudenhygromyxa sp. WMMC2535]NVB39134.1 methylmalonyl Co-A mutase-associated GTPase MeaB [Pseudenhygromyxa sp. WMMC2535]
MTRARPSVDELERGVSAGERPALGRAITLVESRLAADQVLARALLERLLPRTGAGLRVGITGVPGVGKSTFIEALGKQLTAAGTRVAVLAVDPSSTRSGGSILGDKTRMQELARDPLAFVRPSPSRGSLGGVARRTREVMLLCEAAGYEVVLVETVGVGQSETMVAGMVDFFLVLMLAGAGDELQGIKRGILELADMVAINKADGDNQEAARRARVEYARALHLMPRKSAHWTVPVVTCSGLSGLGVAELWAQIQAFRAALEQAGEWQQKRAEQGVQAMWRAIEWGLLDLFRGDAALRERVIAQESRVRAGELTPDHAALELLRTFRP